jgi:hypothetical protein
LTSIGSRECDESVHLARGPNLEFHARSIGPYLRDGRTFPNTGASDRTVTWAQAARVRQNPARAGT